MMKKLKYFKDYFSLDDFIGMVDIGIKSKNQNKWNNVKLLNADIYIFGSCSNDFFGKKTYDQILDYLYNNKTNPIEEWIKLAEKGTLLPFISKNFKLININRKYEFPIVIEDFDICAGHNFHIIFSKINLTYYVSFWYEDLELAASEYTFFDKNFKSQNKAILFLNNFLIKQMGLNKDLKLKNQNEELNFYKNINKLINTLERNSQKNSRNIKKKRITQ
jgi:hypothetical protein